MATSPPQLLEFGTYVSQVGGHGQSTDTGLVTLFDGAVICKPIGIDHRGYIEATFYRDLAIALVTRGDYRFDMSAKSTPFSPVSSTPPTPHVHVTSTTTNHSDQISNTVITTTTTHFGWFGIDHIEEWYKFTEDQDLHHQNHFLHLISPQQIQTLMDCIDMGSDGAGQRLVKDAVGADDVGSSSSSSSSASLTTTTPQPLSVPSYLRPILSFILNYQLPINPLPPSNYPLRPPRQRHELFLSWYYRSLAEKAQIYPIPLGFIVKHHIQSGNNEPCYPINPYEQLQQQQHEQQQTSSPPPHHNHETKPYLVLQSLTNFYTNPAVIDIKMGQMSWGFDAKFKKMDYEVLKGPQQQEMGFRLVGANIPVVHTMAGTTASSFTAPTPTTTIKLNRHLGQSLHRPDQLLPHLATVLSSFHLTNDYAARNEAYLHLSLDDYTNLIQTRIQLQSDVNLCMRQQLQEIVLLQHLYPTHHSVASSVLMSFEANPVNCEELVQAWKQHRLGQFRAYRKHLLTMGDTSSLSTIPIDDDDDCHTNVEITQSQWTEILNAVHQLYLQTLIEQYHDNVSWFTDIVNLYNNNNNSNVPSPITTTTIKNKNINNNNSIAPTPSDLFSTNHRALFPTPLPITLNIIDLAHCQDPTEFQKKFSLFKAGKCNPSQDACAITHIAHRPPITSATTTTTTTTTAPTRVPDEEPIIQLPGNKVPMPLAAIYRHECTASNQIWVPDMETLSQTGIANCPACFQFGRAAADNHNNNNHNNFNHPPAPMMLPRPYQQFTPSSSSPPASKFSEFKYPNSNIESIQQSSSSSSSPSSSLLLTSTLSRLDADFPLHLQSRSILPLLYADAEAMDQDQSPQATLSYQKWNDEINSDSLFASQGMGWQFPLLCPHHHRFTLSPTLLNKLSLRSADEKGEAVINPPSLPVVHLLPLPIQHQLSALSPNLNTTCNPSSRQHSTASLTNPTADEIIPSFGQDHAHLNSLKSLLAYLISTEHVILSNSSKVQQ